MISPTPTNQTPAAKEVKHWTSDMWDAIKGDGCTGVPDLYNEKPCQRHDRHYESHVHRDGTPITRFEADVELAKDSWKALPIVPPDAKWTLPGAPWLSLRIIGRAVIKPIAPVILFTGVRLFGAPHW